MFSIQCHISPKVLDAGKMVAFDIPYLLLQNEEGFFTKMVQETGKTEAAILRQVAENKYRVRHSTVQNGPSTGTITDKHL